MAALKNVLLASVGAVSVGAVLEISAQDVLICNFARRWLSPTTASGPASAPVSDTGVNSLGSSNSYFAQGHSVVAFRNVAEDGFPAGSRKWIWDTPTLADIPNAPTVVRLSGTSSTPDTIFAAAADGVLYKIDASTGITTASVDTRRRLGGTLLCPSDSLTGSPAVQLYETSNAEFKAAIDAVAGRAGDDLVFVITHNGCSDTTRNRVIAYWASDLALNWTFNADNAVFVDAGIAGCTIDYSSNTIYCGTRHQQGSAGTQRSLFALATDTTTTDNFLLLRWATNAGDLVSRVVLHNGRLYAVATNGMLQAFDPAGNGLSGSAPLWTNPLLVAPPGILVVRNLAPVGDSLLVVDTGGTLRRIRDLGSSGTVVWESNPEPGNQYSSAPVAVESLGKGYIGRDDGLVQEIDLTTGQGGKAVVVDAGQVVFDPSLDVEAPASDFNRLAVVAGGSVGRFSIPFCPPTPPQDTTPPAVAGSVTPAANAAGWNNTLPTVTWSVQDPESGISTSNGCDSTTIGQETSGLTLTCSATNGAGLSSSASVTVRLDTIAPTITGSRSPTANANGWSNSDVTASFVCADERSGVASCTSPQIVSTEGSGQAVAGTTRDVAGNESSATVAGINIDKTAPIVTISQPPDGAVYALNQSVAASYACADALSGVASCSGPVPPGGPVNTTAAGVRTFTVAAQDQAGNQASSTHGYVVQQPISSIFLDGDGPLANPPTLFFNSAPPVGTTPRYKDSPSVAFSGGNPWKTVGTWSAPSALTVGGLTSVGDLHLWLGLKNSDDQGTQFDVRAEVLRNGIVVAAGESYCVPGLVRNPDQAQDVAVPFSAFDSVTFDGDSDTLSMRISTRIGTNGGGVFCGGHNSAVGLRVYFDAATRASGFRATLVR